MSLSLQSANKAVELMSIYVQATLDNNAGFPGYKPERSSSPTDTLARHSIPIAVQPPHAAVVEVMISLLAAIR
jgi:hypothetical protein